MTVKECYDAIDADYDAVIGRLRSDERIQKFLLMMLKDKSYEQLCTALEAGKAKDAFLAAHTIKGISQNLSLSKLYESASEMSDVLRDTDEVPSNAAYVFEKVRADYNNAAENISKLL
jgi:HPt (histidine-containing phosphotransfer) domain-containing protein